jgi:hypothetical protein
MAFLAIVFFRPIVSIRDLNPTDKSLDAWSSMHPQPSAHPRPRKSPFSRCLAREVSVVFIFLHILALVKSPRPAAQDAGPCPLYTNCNHAEHEQGRRLETTGQLLSFSRSDSSLHRLFVKSSTDGKLDSGSPVSPQPLLGVVSVCSKDSYSCRRSLILLGVPLITLSLHSKLSSFRDACVAGVEVWERVRCSRWSWVHLVDSCT